MKYIISFLLSIAMVVRLCTLTNVYADEVIVGGNRIMDIGVAQIIDSQLSNNEKELLKSNDDLNLSNEPILKVYCEIYWFLAGKSVEEIVTEAEMYSKAQNYADYYVFSDTPYRIRFSQNETVKVDSKEEPQYIKDICTLSKQVTANEKQSELKGIYCFDAESSHQGIIVYIQTDTDVWVKYYEDSGSDAQLYSEDEFQGYATDYYAYISSYENNYNENGEGLGGYGLSFKEYMDNRKLNDNSKGINDKNNNLSLSKSNNNYLWIGCVVLFGIGAIIFGFFAFIKLKKKSYNSK